MLTTEKMLTNATYADLLRPRHKAYAGFYDVALIIGGSLAIALCTRVRFLLPFTRIPLTGQTFAVLMIGALFGARRGCLAALFYILQGMAGLPVFALGGGFAILRGWTGGYIVGFLPAAYITGLLAQNGWDRRMGTTILAMLLGNAVIFTFGLLWLCRLMGFTRAVLVEGLYPFIIGDLLKVILAAILLPSGWRLLRYTRALSHVD